MLTTDPFDDDKLREECGIFGVCDVEGASAMVALGLHALQHRGQEAAGISSFDDHDFHTHRAMGHVAGNFDREEIIGGLVGRSAIGHVRYSTTGETSLRNVQPLYADLATGGFAVAHNGNISNAMTVRHDLVRRGSIFQSTSDTEVIIHLVATSGYRTLLDRLIDALKRVEGAYSLLCLTTEGMIACRDPLGIRPLVMGKLGDSIIFASETVALDIVGAEFIRAVEPGELVVVRNGEIASHKPFIPVSHRPCIFEHVYFSRPDSIVEGISVYSVRKAIGAELARENGVDVDYVIPVPDSGTPAALGYAEASGIPFELGIIRSHYVGRTFIQPGDGVRHLGVKLKHNANRNLVAGKKIVLIDDSIVRGTTSLKIVQMMREAGAAEVHMRIASPPTMNSCFYGVDTPERSKLLASRMDVEEMRAFIQADSLAFLSIDGLYRALGEDARHNGKPQYCDACFTGDYPTSLTDHEEHEAGDLIMLGERKSPDVSKALEGKVALVTGASRGIGAATAKALAAQGAHVILTARTVKELEAVEDAIFEAGGNATIAPLDLTDGDSISRLAVAVTGRWEKLDILVLNAAMLGTLAPVPAIDGAEFAKLFTLNVTAQQVLIASFDALLRKSDAGRLIALTSTVGASPRSFWGAYGASKAALENLVTSYAEEVKNLSPVRVAIVNPGKTRTKMRAAAYPGEDPSTVKEPSVVADAIVDLVQSDFETGTRISIEA